MFMIFAYIKNFELYDMFTLKKSILIFRDIINT